MDLVDEQHRPHTGHRKRVTRLVDGGPHVLHPGRDRRQLTEPAPTGTRYDVGQGCLAGTRRPPQQDRGRTATLGQTPQRAARPEQVTLPDDIVESAGAQPGRERTRRREGLLEPAIEQVHPPTV